MARPACPQTFGGRVSDVMEDAPARRPSFLHRFRSVAVVVVVLELLLIAGFGIWAARNEYYQYGDEMSHFSYTKYVVDHGRLPLLGYDVVTPEVLRLNREHHGGVMDCGPSVPTPGITLCGIYEAFQPPLYYLATVPAYALGRWSALGGSEDRAFTFMRLFGVAMLLVTAGLTMLLVRDVVGAADATAVSALVLPVFLLPGTVIRFVTLGNAVLELPMAALLALLLWRAWTRDSGRLLVGAAAVYGLCVLTKVTLAPLAAPLAVTALVLLWRRRRSWKRGAVLAGLTALVPLLLVAPWLVSNHRRYDAWTANDLARRIQQPVINPTNRAYPYHEILDEAGGELQRIVVPQEWSGGFDIGIAPEVRWLLALVLAGVPLLLAIARACGWRRRAPDDVADPRALTILLAPFPLAVVFLTYEMHVQRWNLVLGRYFLYALPLLVVFGALQWRAVLGSRRRVVALGVATAAVAVVLWALLIPHMPVDAERRLAGNAAAALTGGSRAA
jgi:4-amino-4-deoxy-L-arabinose transferase-like glycosyltransferase